MNRLILGRVLFFVFIGGVIAPFGGCKAERKAQVNIEGKTLAELEALSQESLKTASGAEVFFADIDKEWSEKALREKPHKILFCLM